ncbi:MAG: hypothetical protein HYZ08_00745 [Candidatus Kerfeldbacteria bacterium]|nr:hypothetical protein [Candidatus Kerfeldbacteria bacterium]
MINEDLRKNIQSREWEQYWSGKWSFTTASYFLYYYTHLMKAQMGEGFTTVAAISREGHTTCFFDKSDRKRFGEHLVKQVLADSTFIPRFCKNLKQRADHFSTVMTRLKQQPAIRPDDFNIFIQEFYAYTGPHISPRHIIDFLPEDKQQTYFSDLKDVRLYTEHVYADTEQLMQQWATQISEKLGLAPTHVLCLTREEVEHALESQNVPNHEILQERFHCSALIAHDEICEVATGEDAISIEQLLAGIDSKTSELSGTIAYAGNVRGHARIVLNPSDVSDFQEGDILVSTMTRPEFLPLMKKAAGIVTDLGGLLCHAAIVARELRKPTIIGTENATKIFKDGDTIEIDSDRAQVRKISLPL